MIDIGDARLPLHGVKVVDLTLAVAGPFASRILADLGATVIKLDTRGTRSFADSSSLGARLQGMYLNGQPGAQPWNTSGPVGQLNRNKFSTVCDLGSPDGRAKFFELIRTADCAIDNFRPTVMPSLGLSNDTLLEVNPRLVYVAMPGFGCTGPYSDYPAFAPTTEAAGGLASLLGYEDGTRVGNTMAFGDFVAGLYAALAAIHGISAARSTGRGAFFDLSHAEAISTLLGDQLTNSVDVLYQGNTIPGALVSGCWPALGFDEWISITVDDEIQLNDLCEVLIHGDQSAEELLRNRNDHTAIFENLPKVTRRWNKHQLAKELQARGIAAGPVNYAYDLLSDPQLTDGFFVNIDDELTGRLPYEGQPFHFDTHDGIPNHRSPRLGEHTAEFLNS